MADVIRQIWIPHGDTSLSKFLPPESDPCNPPLTDEAQKKASELPNTLYGCGGRPSVIFRADKLACLQMSEATIQRFASYSKRPLIITMDNLCRPEHFEFDFEARAYRMFGSGKKTEYQECEDWVSEITQCVKAAICVIASKRRFSGTPLGLVFCDHALFATAVSSEPIHSEEMIEAIYREYSSREEPFAVFEQTEISWSLVQ